MKATRTVCIVFAIDIIEIGVTVVGVYDNERMARKRIGELRKVGLLCNCYLTYRNEELWEEGE